MKTLEAIDKLIDVIKLNNYNDGVATTVSALWDTLELSAEDCKRCAIDGFTRQVIRSARNRCLPDYNRLRTYTEQELKGSSRAHS
jgi:hypothetical protein